MASNLPQSIRYFNARFFRLDLDRSKRYQSLYPEHPALGFEWRTYPEHLAPVHRYNGSSK